MGWGEAHKPRQVTCCRSCAHLTPETIAAIEEMYRALHERLGEENSEDVPAERSLA